MYLDFYAQRFLVLFFLFLLDFVRWTRLSIRQRFSVDLTDGVTVRSFRTVWYLICSRFSDAT